MQVETLRQRAFKRLQQMLASGELGPNREVTETALAKALGTSLTPVREALRQMEVEGLLEYAPHYGAVVRLLNPDELHRLTLEPPALTTLRRSQLAHRVEFATAAGDQPEPELFGETPKLAPVAQTTNK